ncbi:MAG TPA: serine/threonine-protein kinase [Rhodanobacteraceae bacterium]|nr:serine/threonine-protein kinase [Rhodanobacteraceae bacterium]
MDRQRADELFDQVIEIAADQRAAWLRGACGDNGALRTEVERMLRIDAKASDFLESPPTLITDSSSAARGSAQPRQFGPWRVLRSLGAGGMGEVWLAERSDGEFEQRVAIKQLAYPTPGLLQRFRRERQILAGLEHPNIARLLDGGVDADGAPYLVMEYVEGVPVTEYARRHALDLRGRLRLFLQVCDAVRYAHQNLVVHRDLKPSNVHVSEDGTPKLLDFGIAKVLATTDENAPTGTATRMLTPDYAAPEQFRGEPVTTATDVYALGVVLYELLADARPARRMWSTGAANRSTPIEEPAPPSAALDRGVVHAKARRRALRGDLDRITLTALAADRAQRYPSAEALGEDIRRYLADMPIHARGHNAWYGLRKFAGRHRYALGAAVIVVAVSVSAAIVSLHQTLLARAQANRAEAERQFLVGVFQQASPDQNQGQPITAQQLLDRGEHQLARLKPSPLRADLAALLGGLYWEIGDSDKVATLLPQLRSAAADPSIPAEIKARVLIQLTKLDVYQRRLGSAVEHARAALVLARGIGDAGRDEAADARHELSNTLADSNPAQAEPLLRQLLAEDRAQLGERSEEVLDDLRLLGVALGQQSRFSEAESVLRSEIALARSIHGDNDASVINGLNELATVLQQSGHLPEAEAAYTHALALETARIGATAPQSLVIRSNLIKVFEREGQFKRALAERLDMARIEGGTFADERPDLAALGAHHLAGDYRELGRFDEAETAVRRSLALWHRVDPSGESIDFAPVLENLGVVLTLRGRYDEAEDALRRTLDLMQKHGMASSQYFHRLRGELGDVLRLQHRFKEAREEIAAAASDLAESLTEAGTPKNPVLAGLQAQLAEAEFDAGDARGAQATATSALTMARKVLPPRNYRLGAPLFALARADIALGRAADAEPLLREALAVRSPPYPADDPRVLEVKVALAVALRALHRGGEARAIEADIDPMLGASTSPYAADLRARLATP